MASDIELHLSAEGHKGRPQVSAAIDPVNGGRLSSLKIDDHELLVSEDFTSNNSAANPMAWGSYPMVPFAGRVRHGILTADGQSHQIPINLGPHAIHGYGYADEWDVQDHPNSTEASLAWAFRSPWPWEGLCTQSFLLEPDRLVVSMTVEAQEPQPVGFGWHPWFKRNIGNGHDLELHFEAASMYQLDNEAIPTGKLVSPPPGPWDNCFTNLSHGPTLRWGPLTVELTASTDYWVIFTEPEHALCVEPQTGPPNDVNDKPFLLDAGQTASLQFELQWST